MPWIRKDIVDAVKQAQVRVVKLDRKTAKIWSERNKKEGLLRSMCGYYWQQMQNRRVIATDTAGPFSSETAAQIDAYHMLGLNVNKFTYTNKKYAKWSKKDVKAAREGVKLKRKGA